MVQKVYGKTTTTIVSKGDPTANVRMEYLTEKVIFDYIALLKEELTKGNFMNFPSNVVKLGYPWEVVHH